MGDFFGEIDMEIESGKSYHISDNFFLLVNDPKLMSNKEGGRYRPHFFLFSDNKIDGIYWAVPQSSQYEKYKRIVEQKINKYGKCNTIVLGKFAGKNNAFLIQNMFPIIEKYVDHEHTIQGLSINISTKLEKVIIANARQVLSLHNMGHELIFPDIDRIYALMEAELKKDGLFN
jgi:hypothetical protein